MDRQFSGTNGQSTRPGTDLGTASGARSAVSEQHAIAGTSRKGGGDMPDVEGELRARAAADGVEFFFALFVDMHGRPCAKMVPVEALGVMLGGGSGLPGVPPRPTGPSPPGPDPSSRPH